MSRVEPGSLTAIVLAAGQGTRMKSAKPKVLHELCGRPMVHYVVDAALAASVDDVVVVVGHGREDVSTKLTAAFGDRVRTAVQSEQRGTGHAVLCAMPALSANVDRVLLLCGDTPLLDPATIRELESALTASAPLAMLTMEVADPTGYGRILRDERGRVTAIREHRDATVAERAIREVNPGVYLARASFLREALAKITANNAQGELYLTDLVELATSAGGVVTLRGADPSSLVGINDRAQLAAAEEVMFGRIADRLRRAGATIRASARIDASVAVAPDATIEHGVVLRGATRIGARARVDVGSVLTDTIVAEDANVKPYSVAQRASIGERAEIGPFSHLRPDSAIDEEAHVGNFVETKKTRLRRGAKANHLAYLGDGDIGEKANIGAGTIFCNYDGFRKHTTEIGPGAFIGSDSQLVAPVKIGAGAYVATGTTVTKDVPDDALAIARTKQENKAGYAPRLRARLGAGAPKKTSD